MKEWLSKIFEDVKDFSPINGDRINVSELTTHKIKSGISSTRDYQTVLIKPELIELIKPEEINPTTECSVHPIYDADYEYKGYATVFISNIEGLKKVEPLVISWHSANYTSFQPDPYFLITYGLTPRLTNKFLVWDNLRKPETEVVKSIPASNYDFPVYSESFVSIKREYLQDYSSLRKKSLIQIYCETRILPTNNELQSLIGEKGYFEKTTKTAHFRIKKIDDENIFTEVTGYRPIKLKSKPTISTWDRKGTDHIWPGFKEPVSKINANHWNYVYVSDEVLDKYEQDERYSVCPETGGVSYKNQWAVSRCYRIGRNHIKIELFKLYEGTPNEIINYWNKFAVDINNINTESRNIAERAKGVVFSYLKLGELLSNIINNSLNLNLTSQDIIKINREELNYYGWYNNKTISPITNHLNHQLRLNLFLIRQKELNFFLVDNLNEKTLRGLIKKLKIDLTKFRNTPNEVLRSIKLLNILLNYLKISIDLGLDIIEDSIDINSRLEDELIELEITKLLNAINTMRQLDSHKSDTSFESKLSKSLEIFELDRKEFTSNYLLACELIYDKIANCLNQTNSFIVGL